MAETTQVITPPARLELFGFRSVPAKAELVRRPRSLRVTRALVSLAVCWGIMPVVFLVPPHVPWVLAAFGAGIYLAWTNWRGTHEVRGVEGPCPSCGQTLTIEPGTKISLPHKITCYHCHQEPFFEAEA